MAYSYIRNSIRKELKKIQICEYCLINKATENEHFLPKKYFDCQERLNFYRVCSKCNSMKSYLHPYKWYMNLYKLRSKLLEKYSKKMKLKLTVKTTLDLYNIKEELIHIDALLDNFLLIIDKSKKLLFHPISDRITGFERKVYLKYKSIESCL